MLFDVKFAKSLSSLLNFIILSISSLICVFGDISEIYTTNWGNNNCNRVFESSPQPTKLSLTISLLV